VIPPEHDDEGPWPVRLRRKVGERLGERGAGIALTLLVEMLLLAMLLSLGLGQQEEVPVFSSLTTMDMGNDEEEATAEEAAEDQPAPEQPASPNLPQPVAQPPLPSALPSMPRPVMTPQPVAPEPVPPAPPSAAPTPNRPRAVIRPDRSYGPSGGPPREGDSQVVGTAPDGQPLYAARWYTEPTEQEMGGYLSVVEAPAWALIACRTAPRWEVRDCVGLEQFPPTSAIMNAVLASTWQFRVRPPQRGGQPLVGSWVRIRISYGDRASR
jgi:periplasmic protein TonB